MTITTGNCASFKLECLQGVHDFRVDTIKAALYTDAATLDATTTVYTTDNELSATGYTAGGVVATVASGYPALNGNVAEVRFDIISWETVTGTFRGVMLYNASKANRAIVIQDFGSNIDVVNGPIRLAVALSDPAPITLI